MVHPGTDQQKLRIIELSQGGTRDSGEQTRFCKHRCCCDVVLNQCAKMGAGGIYDITNV